MALTDYASEIEALEAAIASGARSVSYDGKSTTFDDLDAMLRRLAWLKGRQQVATTGRRRPSAGFASFDRGDR